MLLWQDGIIAMLAAIGLTTILWGLAELVFRKRDAEPGAVVLLPLRGEAPGMEYHVQTLLARRRRLDSAAAIVLLDCGLNEENIRRAERLTARYKGIVLLRADELEKIWQQM